jgi:hypothetical protein
MTWLPRGLKQLAALVYNTALWLEGFTGPAGGPAWPTSKDPAS